MPPSNFTIHFFLAERYCGMVSLPPDMDYPEVNTMAMEMQEVFSNHRILVETEIKCVATAFGENHGRK